ncbi:amidohydrolase 2 [Massarina eburnea CBS 473.64]|uniref:6-methylsalicylate decarboxylase n=1 Tax=Massarina eburnea CBS 473.64 TaxID=1395130 RepID=A0A6A6SF74_9PLEO|nr:amidohydrolase 2 [Massarina eburnea CBS 473.64]
MTNPLPPRIDVHSHFLPPFYRTALENTGNSYPDGMPAIPPWSPSAHFEMMASANVTKSILSISSPGTHLYINDSLARTDLTRKCNAYAADLKKQYPEKIGFWASLPLPDVERSLEEIERAIGEGCDGFALMTNYHGSYLGDERFGAVFERLDQLGATVFLHPTCPCIPDGHGTEPVSGEGGERTKALPFESKYPVPIFEFLFDTARAVINLFYSGTVSQCSNIRFIVPHVGGTLPPLITRFTVFGSLVPGVTPLDPATVRKQIQEQFYFDLAGLIFDGETGGRGQLKAFVEGWDISYKRLLYGSDFPFTNHGAVGMLAQRMNVGLEHLFDAEERGAVYEGNAKRLLEEAMSGTRK